MKIIVTGIRSIPQYVVLDVIIDHQDNSRPVEPAEVYIDMVYYPGRWTSKPIEDSNALPIENEKIIELVLKSLLTHRDKLLSDISKTIEMTADYLSRKDEIKSEVHDGMAVGAMLDSDIQKSLNEAIGQSLLKP